MRRKYLGNLFVINCLRWFGLSDNFVHRSICHKENNFYTKKVPQSYINYFFTSKKHLQKIEVEFEKFKKLKPQNPKSPKS